MYRPRPLKVAPIEAFRRHLDADGIMEMIDQAAKTLKNMPKVGIHQKFCNWPDYVPLYPDTEKRVYIVPTSQQISDMHVVVLDWLPWIEKHPCMGKDYARIVWSVSNDMPWQMIADAYGKSKRTVQNRYQEAITHLFYSLKDATYAV
jgi:hypothetical protein